MDNACSNSSYLDDVRHVGYLGLVLCYIRTISNDRDKYLACYDTLRELLEARGYSEEPGFDYVVDFAMSTRLRLTSRIALDEYFGLESFASHNVEDATIAMNRLSMTLNLPSRCYEPDEVGVFIGEGLKALGKDVEFVKLARTVCEEADRRGHAKCDDPDERECCCGSQCCNSSDSCRHCSSDTAPSTTKKAGVAKKASSKKNDSKSKKTSGGGMPR